MTSFRWLVKHAEHGDKPWEVQVKAAELAGDQRGYIWFLEQGLGKTSLALNDFIDKWDRDLCDFMLVWSPNSFKGDWAAAPGEWGLSSLRTWVWPKFAMADATSPGLLAVNYEATRSKSNMKVLADLCKSCRVYMCIDESLAIGNYQSGTSRQVRELAKLATFVRELNGTPYSRDVTELYPQLRAVGQLNGVNPVAFRRRYTVSGGYMGKQVVGADNEKELAEILSRCSFRALKTKWRKDLPPKIRKFIHISLTNRQRKHYRAMVEDFFTQVKGLEVSADMVLTQMGKLRQISSGIAMHEGKVEWIEPPETNPKILAALDAFDAGTSKMIVSYVYRPMGDALMVAFKKADPVRIAGGMKSSELLEVKRKFNNDPNCRIMVAQQSAAFRGHTLIGCPGDWASRMLFVENEFSHYQRVQMEDRIHRGAQEDPCLYFDMVVSPIDKKVIQNLAKKREGAEAIDGIVTEVQRFWLGAIAGADALPF